MKNTFEAEIEVEKVRWSEEGREDPLEEAIISVVSAMSGTPEKARKEGYSGIGEAGRIMMKETSSS
jgi:hypothetical protein